MAASAYWISAKRYEKHSVVAALIVHTEDCSRLWLCCGGWHGNGEISKHNR